MLPSEGLDHKWNFDDPNQNAIFEKKCAAGEKHLVYDLKL